MVGILLFLEGYYTLFRSRSSTQFTFTRPSHLSWYRVQRFSYLLAPLRLWTLRLIQRLAMYFSNFQTAKFLRERKPRTTVTTKHANRTQAARIMYQWNLSNEEHGMVYTAPINEHLSEITYSYLILPLCKLQCPRNVFKLLKTSLACYSTLLAWQKWNLGYSRFWEAHGFCTRYNWLEPVATVQMGHN